MNTLRAHSQTHTSHAEKGRSSIMEINTNLISSFLQATTAPSSSSTSAHKISEHGSNETNELNMTHMTHY